MLPLVTRFILVTQIWLLTLVPAAHADSGEVSAARRPFLWKIEAEPPSYLFGTVHVPDARVLDLPASVREALDAARFVYTEVPMDVRSQLEAQKLSMFSGATTLRDVLPEELFSRLEAFLDERGMPMLIFTRFKVWAVATTLPMLAQLQNAGSRPVLDLYLAETARSADKETDALETVASQVAAMESMGEQGQVAMLAQTLDQLERAEEAGTDALEDMIQAYLSGDDERLLGVAQAQLDESDVMTPKLQEALIYGRNRTMSETIRKKLAERPGVTHFFAIGALHYPGDRGIVSLLRESGLRVSRAP